MLFTPWLLSFGSRGDGILWNPAVSFLGYIHRPIEILRRRGVVSAGDGRRQGRGEVFIYLTQWPKINSTGVHFILTSTVTVLVSDPATGLKQRDQTESQSVM